MLSPTSTSTAMGTDTGIDASTGTGTGTGTVDGHAAPPRRRSGILTVLCWLIVLPGLGWAAIRLGGLERNGLVQLLAFTPYVAAWTLVPLALAAALHRWWAAAAAALAVLALAGAIVPRALPDGGPMADGPVLRVLSTNLLKGSADPTEVLALVREHRVDVLAVQEFTPTAQLELDRLGLATLLPHQQVNPEPGVTGSAVYARFPLRDGGTRRNRAGGFTQAYATMDVPGGPTVLIESAHPCAPSTVRALRCWWPDLARQPPATPDGPLRILAGDFNATLDHVALRRLLDTGYVDAAAVTGDGLIGTWGPYDGDPIPPVTIDHVLVDWRISARVTSVHSLPRSDHRAVFAELVLPRS